MEPHVAVRAVAGEPDRIVVANMADVRTGLGRNPTTQIEVHRSLDGGATWTSALFEPSLSMQQDPLGMMNFSGDAVLAYAPDGKLYLAGVVAMGPIEDIPLLGPCCLISSLSVFVVRSLDDGLTWSAPVYWQGGLGPAPLGTMQDKPWLAVGTDGTLHFGWTEFTSFPFTDLQYTRSLDGGATWSAPVTFAANAFPLHDVYSGLTLAAPGDDLVYASWSVVANGSTQAPGTQVVAVSDDNGATWGAPVTLGASMFPRFGHVCASADDPLRAHVVVPDANQRLTIATTQDGGVTWSAAQPISTRFGPQPLGACHADADSVRVAHYDASWPGGEHAVLTTLDEDGDFVDERALSGAIDPAERRREYLAIAADGDAAWAVWVGGDASSKTWIEAATAAT